MSITEIVLLFGTVQTVLLGLVAWLGKAWLERMQRKEQLDADRRLEAVRHELELQRQQVLLTLTTESERTSRLGALAGQYLGSSQSAVQSKRLDAIDRLWLGVLANRTSASMASVLDTAWPPDQLLGGKAAEASRRTFGARAMPDVLKLLKQDTVEEVRPFLSPHLWRLYFLYRAVNSRAIVHFADLSFTKKPTLWYSDPHLAQSIRAALPEETWARFNNAPRGKLAIVAGHLENQILAEIARWTSGVAPTEEQLHEVKRLAVLFETATPAELAPLTVSVDA